MNQVAILVVGNEILDGIVLDTNTQWIITRLKPLGLAVKKVLTIRDDVLEIARAVNQLRSESCDFIITSGGLGPTHDDITLSGVAEAFNLPMELNNDALAIVSRQYSEIHRRGIVTSAEITIARQKMAIFPRGAKPLDNRVGGAPGAHLEVNGVEVISLPGVPSELMWIFDNQLIPLIVSRVKGAYYEEVISLPLRDESTVAPLIDEAMRRVPGVWIKSLVKPYGETGIRFWISARGDDKRELESKVGKAARLILELYEERLR